MVFNPVNRLVNKSTDWLIRTYRIQTAESFKTPTELESWAQSAKPVFIGGMPRSGTSMMLRSISGHSEFRSIKRVTESHLFSDTNTLSLPIKLRPTAIGFLGGWNVAKWWTKNTNKILNETNITIRQSEDTLEVTSLKGDQTTPSPTLIKTIILSYFYTLHLIVPEKRIAEKSPENVNFIDSIFTYFPKSIFIGMVRNPLEVVASHRRRYKMQSRMGFKENELQWLRQTAENYVKKYNEIRSTLRSAQRKFPDKIIICNYSQITQDPSFEMEKLASNLGISYEETMLGNNGTAGGWDPLLRVPIQPNLYDLTEYLSAQEINYIKSHADYEFMN